MRSELGSTSAPAAFRSALPSGVQNVHADLFEDLQRGIVDGLKFIGGNGSNRLKRQARLLLGRLRRGVGAPAIFSAATAWTVACLWLVIHEL